MARNLLECWIRPLLLTQWGFCSKGKVIQHMDNELKPWGKQNLKCPSCKTPSTMTYQTAYDDYVSNSYCVRYFERVCSNCSYWSGWVWVNNGKVKLPIQ